MCKTYHNRLKPNLEDFKLHHLDCDSYFYSFETKDIFIDMSKSKESFDFSNLHENQELISNMIKRDIDE